MNAYVYVCGVYVVIVVVVVVEHFGHARALGYYNTHALHVHRRRDSLICAHVE